MLSTMRPKVLLFSMLALASAIFISFAFTKPASINEVNEDYISANSEQDWNACVQKHADNWGGRCLNYGFSEGKYSIELINTCSEKVDLMCCVQNENQRWHCFYRMDMGSNDTLYANACHGSGKYLKWVRKAGDVLTKFPTRQQVNDQY